VCQVWAVETTQRREPSTMQVTMIGLDLAKNQDFPQDSQGKPRLS
jgi:hypothetical protein